MPTYDHRDRRYEFELCRLVGQPASSPRVHLQPTRAGKPLMPSRQTPFAPHLCAMNRRNHSESNAMKYCNGPTRKKSVAFPRFVAKTLRAHAQAPRDTQSKTKPSRSRFSTQSSITRCSLSPRTEASEKPSERPAPSGRESGDPGNSLRTSRMQGRCSAPASSPPWFQDCGLSNLVSASLPCISL